MKLVYGLAAATVVVAGIGVWQSGLLNGHAEEAMPMDAVEKALNAAEDMKNGAADSMENAVREMEEAVDKGLNIEVPEQDVRAFNRSDLPKALRYRETDITLGDPNAPVQMVEYASKTCSHCADFHNNTLPLLKDGVIAEGKVFFIYRELPWDNLAMLASKVSRCAPKAQQMSFVEVFYSTQSQWAQAEDPVAELKKMARLGGMDADTFTKCAEDEDLQKLIMAGRQEALEDLKVQGTPTVYVDATPVQNAQSVATIEQMVDELIAKRK